MPGVGCRCHEVKNPFPAVYSQAWPILKTLHLEKHVLSKEECREVGEAEGWGECKLALAVAVKPLDLVKQTLDVLHEYEEDWWYSVAAKAMKVLSELYQQKLVTEDEVKRMKGEVGDLADRLIPVQCTKSQEVMTRTADLLNKFGYNDRAKTFRVLSELYQQKLVTEDEVKRMKFKNVEYLADQLIPVQCTKSQEVMTRTADLLDKFGYNDKAKKFRGRGQGDRGTCPHSLSTSNKHMGNGAGGGYYPGGLGRTPTAGWSPGTEGTPPSNPGGLIRAGSWKGRENKDRSLPAVNQDYCEMEDTGGAYWNPYLYQLQLEAPSPICVSAANEVPDRPPFYANEYHGTISHQECAALLGNNDGHYLVRAGLRNPGTYSLSLVFDGRIRHFRLYYHEGFHYTGEKMFESIDDLVADGLIVLHMEKHNAMSYIDDAREIIKTKAPSPPTSSILGSALTVPKSEMPFRRLSMTGFTEVDCSRLYHKAIRDNTTIILHIAKAMTIGPPQVGKTSLFYHLLGLPPPDSSSTPVMETANTVSVCPSDSTASPEEVGHVPFSRAILSDDHSSDSEDEASSDDSEDDVGQRVVKRCSYKARMCVVGKNEWVQVNSDSGILSLLTFLWQKMDALVTQNQSSTVPIEFASEPVVSEAIAADMLPSTHTGFHQEIPIQPMGDTSPIQPSGDTSDSVATMSSRMYRELQNPNVANVTLPDVHLLQFLDCGGQLAYHDVLPIFVNIPAIYLHVFNIAKELTECPVDELCSTEGKKLYSAKSALSVADMIARSAMTVHSLADRKVQLPSVVKCESKSPKPHMLLVGTHLDNLVEEDSEATLKAVNKILRKSLQSKSHCLEGMVLKNVDSHHMFFPVNNKLYVDQSHQSRKHSKCKHCRATKRLKRRLTKQAMEDAVKVEVPVKWYLRQLLELSQGAEKPLYSYSELYQRCKEEGSVTDMGEFHAMVTYFHALGLLVHLCGANVGHTEDSDCLVFTNPSYLFENISKLYQVQFEEEVEGVGKLRLKNEGKLTKEALQDLGVQLDHGHFMDLLVQLFIGAEVMSHKGDRILFIPSVLTNSPDDGTPSGVGTKPQEQSLCFALTFEDKHFIPCGVFTGMIARLQSTPGWEICTHSISRMRMEFAVGARATVILWDHSTHISMQIECNEGMKHGQYQKYRDTVIKATADSYCFLFHSKASKDPQSGTCSECRESPYLVLGQTCQMCSTGSSAREAPHFMEVKVEDDYPVSVRCQKTLELKLLGGNVLELGLFQNISYYAVIKEQHTSYSLEGEGPRESPPPKTALQNVCGPQPPLDADPSISKPRKVEASSAETSSSPCPFSGTGPARAQPREMASGASSTVTDTQSCPNHTSGHVVNKVNISDSSQTTASTVLLQTVSDRPDHLMLFRTHVSRTAAGKGRAVLEGVGLDSATIAACFTSHPLNEEEIVQEGLTKWKEGQGSQPSTWAVLLQAMEYALIAQQPVQELKKELGLLRS